MQTSKIPPLVCVIAFFILCILFLYITNPYIEHLDNFDNKLKLIDYNGNLSGSIAGRDDIENIKNLPIKNLLIYDPYNKKYNTLADGACKEGIRALYNWENPDTYSYKCVDTNICTPDNGDLYYYTFNDNEKGLKFEKELPCCPGSTKYVQGGKWICKKDSDTAADADNHSPVQSLKTQPRKTQPLETRPLKTQSLETQSPESQIQKTRPLETQSLKTQSLKTKTQILKSNVEHNVEHNVEPNVEHNVEPNVDCDENRLCKNGTICINGACVVKSEDQNIISSKQKAIILFRHGQKGYEKYDEIKDNCTGIHAIDRQDYLKKNIGYFEEAIDYASLHFPVSYANASRTGYSQAVAYSTNVPNIMEEQNIKDISEVYVFDPKDNANSYLAAYPLLKKLGLRDKIKILDKNRIPDFKGIINDAEGSILIVSENDSLETITKQLKYFYTFQRGRDIYVQKLKNDFELDTPVIYTQNIGSYKKCKNMKCVTGEGRDYEEWGKGKYTSCDPSMNNI